MFMNIFEPSALVLAAIVSSIALATLMGFIIANFQLRRSRLPDATAYEDIRERRVSEEQRLAGLREEARLVEQQIKDRDRLSAEVAALQERLDVIKLEFMSLDTARAEIEDVKHQVAEAAGLLAAAREDVKLVEDQLAKKRLELEEIEGRLGPARIAALEDAVNALKSEKANLDSELPRLRAERDAALNRIEEVRAVEARRAALVIEVEDLESQISGLSERCSLLRSEELNLQTALASQARIVDEVSRLEARKQALTVDVEDLEGKQASLHAMRKEIAEVQSSLGASLNRREELEEEVIRLEARRDRLSAPPLSPPGKPNVLLEDIQQFPSCLAAPAIAAKAKKTESEALGGIAKYVRDCGLDYDHRTLQAFHTCLKINDFAQITVLAGVSGTGKSMLPRRYAEGMGIHFHQIAVEPRWDSPQDLLGFYNYIEQKYRATDLARLLVHMDPYRSVPLEGEYPDRRDHVSLVLLDEMNLARVEYYFSEFLSRLEVRPRLADADDEMRRKNSMIPIDIRGYDKPLALFPSHNVLFVGTMNDDESTQALSDKVLDRGNIMQFAAPTRFNLPNDKPNPSLPSEAMPFATWRGWLRKIEYLSGNLNEADKYVAKLAVIMDDCGRPFGHRLHDAILSYAANYPKSANETLDVRVPIVDQIELRILPKLRGLEINGHAAALGDLEGLIRNDLGDPILADRLGEFVDKQANGSGLFGWRGLTRSNR